MRVGHRIIEINGHSVVATPHARIIELLTEAHVEVRGQRPGRGRGQGGGRVLLPAQARPQPPASALAPPGPHQNDAGRHLPPAHRPGAARVPVTGHQPATVP